MIQGSSTMENDTFFGKRTFLTTYLGALSFKAQSYKRFINSRLLDMALYSTYRSLPKINMDKILVVFHSDCQEFIDIGMELRERNVSAVITIP
jgi:hypothetical protein